MTTAGRLNVNFICDSCTVVVLSKGGVTGHPRDQGGRVLTRKSGTRFSVLGTFKKKPKEIYSVEEKDN